MKITKIRQWTKALSLREPYTIAYETITNVENVFIIIETDGPLVGYGCAAPDLKVTGDTVESTHQSLEEAAEIVRNEDPLRPAYCLSLTKELRGSARAALDMALWDLLGKAANMPLWRLFGGYRSSIATSVTIGIEDNATTVKKAKEWLGRGFKMLKIKGGKDVDEDIERVLLVREAVGENVELRFDANQGYDLQEAIRFVKGVEKAEIEILEQPTPKGDFDLLGRVTEKVDLPVMADESLLSLGDAFHLARGDVSDMLNIKLQKVGGISQAIHINSVARSAKMETMVGCMDESELSIAAGLHFALSHSNVHYADLDGHLDLLDDPAKGAVRLEEGILYPSEKPGLGLSKPLDID